jgi:integrase
MKLTAAAIERIKPPKSGRVQYFDTAHPGLALRVTARGVKSWSYIARVNGKWKRATLGRWPKLTLAKARAAAGEAAETMAAGVDPLVARRAANAAAAFANRDTVESVVNEWLRRDQAGNRSHDEVKRAMERDVLSAWHDRRIQDITRRDVIELIDSIQDRGAAIMARRTLAYIHRLFNWAVARDIVAGNPVVKLPKPGRAVKRDRVLSDDELARVWSASEAVGWPFGPIVQLMILTAARRSEIGRLEWREVDLEAQALRIDGGRTKNGEPHDIALSPAAIEILKALPRIADGDGNNARHVFTTTGDAPVSGWSRAKLALDRKDVKLQREAAKAAGVVDEVEPLGDWRLHDLRRTVATGLQRLGMRLEVTEAVLGHVSGSRGGIVGVYQRHDYADEKRAALIAWANHVARITGGTPTKVVPLRGAS